MKEYYLNFNAGKMAYYLIGSGRPIVILHGWGQNFLSFKNIIYSLRDNYQIIGIDFLGFGLSDDASIPLSVFDYTNHIRKLLEKLDIENPIIIAHSFGGRIAIHYASKYAVEKLILVSSAGIRHKSFKRTISIIRYKMLKNIYRIFHKAKYQNLILNSGSVDFKNATSIMKKTLSNVINYSSYNDLKKVKAKAYLLWGIYDEETKYSDALKMHKVLKTSEVIPFYESRHFCYLEEETKFIREINRILKEAD